MARQHLDGDIENNEYESYDYKDVAEEIIQEAIDCLNANDVDDGHALDWVSDYVDIIDAPAEHISSEQLQDYVDGVLDK